MYEDIKKKYEKRNQSEDVLKDMLQEKIEIKKETLLEESKRDNCTIFKVKN